MPTKKACYYCSELCVPYQTMAANLGEQGCKMYVYCFVCWMLEEKEW